MRCKPKSEASYTYIWVYPIDVGRPLSPKSAPLLRRNYQSGRELEKGANMIHTHPHSKAFSEIFYRLWRRGGLRGVMRHGLTDQQWNFIEDLFPKPATIGRPPADPRKMFEAILWINNTGAKWRDLPSEMGA